MLKSFHIRFGVKDKNNNRSSVWRVWTSKHPKSDVYISSRSIAGILKTSLHESGLWRAAFTTQYSLKNVGKTNRLIEEWPRPSQIQPGYTLAFRFIMPTNDLSAGKFDESKKIIWIDAPVDKDLTEVILIFTLPSILISDWPGKQSMGSKLLSRFQLPNGETMWLIYYHIKAQPEFFIDYDKNLRSINKRMSKIEREKLCAAENPRLMIGGNRADDNSRFYYDINGKNLLK